MISHLIKTRLAARSAAAILALAGILGLIFVAIATTLVWQQESRRQQQQLEGLLNTVESTLGIAGFLEDRDLAEEVIQGLLQNSTVAAVIISTDSKVLARGARDDVDRARPEILSQRPGTLQRSIMSPFTPDQQVGTVLMVPNTSAIRSQIIQASAFVMALLAVQLFAIGIGTILVVVKLITRPIATISNRLHSLKAETGEQLELPPGNKDDEIGQLVNDVNVMIDYMVEVLDTERELRRQREIEERKYRNIFENAETAIFLFDGEGYIDSHNPAFLEQFAIDDSALVSLSSTSLYQLAGEHGPLLRERSARCLETGQNTELEITAGDTLKRWLHLVLSPVEEGYLQGIANDITERKYAQEDAERRAATDPLTGLGNRASLEFHLASLMDDRRRGAALMLLDLDHFKAVNDTYGHQAGDRILVSIANRLRLAARKTDFIARLGGDEFVLLLEGIDETGIIDRLGHNLLTAIHEPIDIGDGVDVSVGASIGIAFIDDQCSADEVVRRADRAMYRAKNSGRNRFIIAS